MPDTATLDDVVEQLKKQTEMLDRFLNRMGGITPTGYDAEKAAVMARFDYLQAKKAERRRHNA